MSFDMNIEGVTRTEAIDQGRTNTALLEMLQDMSRQGETQLTDLTKKHEDLIVAYRVADAAFDKAVHAAQVSDAQRAEIQRETAQVHADVLALQAELTRIDASIRRKAERALIEKGLLDPKDAGRMEQRNTTGAGMFAWPVLGPLTAFFHDVGYQAHFGIPHLAIDIARPQGSPVGAAADGIVFLVRDGGQTGYTYVLIGHKDGFATLYGHLSQVNVTAGEAVQQGQTIGLSGGQPGTPGAGPMTTGQHLHFEVIKQGVNIDPLTVLPKR